MNIITQFGKTVQLQAMIFLLLVVGWDAIVRDVLRGILASVLGLVKSSTPLPTPYSEP